MAPAILRRTSSRFGRRDQRRCGSDGKLLAFSPAGSGWKVLILALPALTEEGELPPGVHRAPLSEVRARFGVGAARRKTLMLRLERIYRNAHATGRLNRFVVFGSFVTRKPEPQDVDVFLVMADAFGASELAGDMRLLFDHGAAQAHFGASVFWVRRRAAWPDEQLAVEFWQVKRGGGRRGIVEIIEETA